MPEIELNSLYNSDLEIWRKKIDCDTGDILFDEKWCSINATKERGKIIVHCLNYTEADQGDPNIEYYIENFTE